MVQIKKVFHGIVVFSLLFVITTHLVAQHSGVSDKKDLEGKRVAVLITEGFHDAETMFPLGFLQNKGADITVIGIEPGTYKAYNSDVTAIVEKSVTEVAVSDFDVLVIPGGRSPENLLKHTQAVDFVKAFMETNKPVASICHGPLVVLATDLVQGKTLTGVSSIQDHITEAGAIYLDEEVVIDGNLITSRIPSDLPAFAMVIQEMLRN